MADNNKIRETAETIAAELLRLTARGEMMWRPKDMPSTSSVVESLIREAIKPLVESVNLYTNGHFFKPQEKDRDYCDICWGNFRHENHYRKDEYEPTRLARLRSELKGW